MVKKQTWKQIIVTKIPKFKWWQIVLILLVGAFIFSGFSIKSKWFSCEKTKPQLKEVKK